MKHNKKIILLLLLTISFLSPNFVKAESEESSVNIPIQAELLGDITGQSFIFSIEENSNTNTLPNETQISIKQNETENFGPFTFTLPGKYVYTIKQVPGKNKDIDYDKNLYKVTVIVENEEDIKGNYTGKLVNSIFVSKNGNGEKVGKIVFNNKYNKIEISKDKEKETTREVQSKHNNPYTGDSGIFSTLLVLGIALILLILMKYKKSK